MPIWAESDQFMELVINVHSQNRFISECIDMHTLCLSRFGIIYSSEVFY
jgi:hypothetical protein